MLGLPAEPLFEEAVLGSAMPENHIREDYVRARIERRADGKLIAIPFSSMTVQCCCPSRKPTGSFGGNPTLRMRRREHRSR